MFDLTSSKLLILAVVALIVVGPKDLPSLMRTVGKYLGMIRRQANEFRAQFEDAMRDSELADLKKEVEKLGSETRDTLNETKSSVETHINSVTSDVNTALAEAEKPANTVGDQSANPVASAQLTDDTTNMTVAEAPPVIRAPPAAMPRPVVTAEPASAASSGSGA